MRVGVVGVGSMGQNHARVYSEIGQLVGVVDADAAVGQRVATRTKSKYCATVDELVAAGVEAASVAVPTNLHRKVAEELIEAGVHVLVEKPLASTVGEAQKLVGTSSGTIRSWRSRSRRFGRVSSATSSPPPRAV